MPLRMEISETDGMKCDADLVNLALVPLIINIRYYRKGVAFLLKFVGTTDVIGRVEARYGLVSGESI